MRKPSKTQFAAVLLSLGLALSSCSPMVDEAAEETVESDSSSSSETASSSETTVSPDENEEDIEELVGSDTKVAFDRTEVVEDIQEFWKRNGTEAGLKAFEPLEDARIYAMGDKPRLRCDSETVPDEEMEDNAFASVCEEGYTVAWDPAFFEDIEARHGAVAPSVILAHEWGHIVMFQADIDLPGLIAEQYADCMAGAWVADAIGREISLFDDPGALDAAVAAAAEFRDEPGTDPNDEEAHGSAFDRIRALQEGFEGGVTYCGSYVDTPPPITQIPFEKGSDTKSKGNMTFAEVLTVGETVLGQFEQEYPESVSIAEMFPIESNRKALSGLHKRLGDSATLVVLALDAAAAQQEEEGRDPEDEGELLQQACVVGSFFGWVFDEGSPDASLSAGDLDEAVATFADLTDPSASGFLFEQLTQMRNGFVQGPEACQIPK